MNNLKPGDKVRVRKDLFSGKTYGFSGAVGPMMVNRGKEVTISTVNSVNSSVYRIAEDKGAWWYSKEMFDGGYDGEVVLEDVPF